MHWLTLNRLLRAERGMQKADLYGQIAAIHKAQAVIEFDLQGHVLMANQNFLDTMGYSLDEVLGQHHRMFIRPEERDSAAYAEFWDKLGQGAYDSGRYRRVRKDGTDIWLQATYSPICDKRGRPLKVIKYATDVSEQQQRQADFEGQLAAISKVQAIIEFELDGTILRANELFLDAMGYRADEVVGRHHSMFVTPEEARGAAYQNSGASCAKAAMTPDSICASARAAGRSGSRPATTPSSMPRVGPSRWSSTPRTSPSASPPRRRCGSRCRA